MNRKAQSEIITTVLLILIVLAAIAIVWMVVIPFLWGSNNDPFKCSDVRLLVNEARSNDPSLSNPSQVEVKRVAGGENDAVKSVKIMIDGKATTIQEVNGIKCIDDDDRPQNGPDDSDSDGTPDSTETDDDNDGTPDSTDTDRNGNAIIDTDPTEPDKDDIQECEEVSNGRTLYSLEQIETKTYGVIPADIPQGSLVQVAPIIEGDDGQEKVCEINDAKRAI